MGNHSRPVELSLELRGPAAVSRAQSCSLVFQLVLIEKAKS